LSAARPTRTRNKSWTHLRHEEHDHWANAFPLLVKVVVGAALELKVRIVKHPEEENNKQSIQRKNRLIIRNLVA
jgi:hypothetical protein